MALEIVGIVAVSVTGYGFLAGVTQAVHGETITDEPVGLIWPVALPYLLALRLADRLRKRNGLPRATARDKSAP